METLLTVYENLGLQDPQTYVQSGNVIFKTSERNLNQLAARIEQGIEKTFGFRSEVILCTVPELRHTIARNPFAGRTGIEPGKLVVTFLAADPGAEARQRCLVRK